MTILHGLGPAAVHRLRSDESPLPGWIPISFTPGVSATDSYDCRAGRLLVSESRPVDATIADLPQFLDPGDVVVINTSCADHTPATQQPVFARNPGGAAVPWAGRAISSELVVNLTVRGVVVAPLTLHSGYTTNGCEVSAEDYEIPENTAWLINTARCRRNRVIAIGTTVLRALEAAAFSDGMVRPGRTATDLVVAPGHRFLVVDGLLTTFHQPLSTHLAIIEALVGYDALKATYEAAVASEYRWGQWGDRNLLLRPAGGGVK